jgi:hypothetical protein
MLERGHLVLEVRDLLGIRAVGLQAGVQLRQLAAGEIELGRQWEEGRGVDAADGRPTGPGR